MKFFIDTADINEIREANAMGILDGVTTNPSLMAKTGRGFTSVVKDIVAEVNGPISLEVTATDVDGMMAEAKKLAEFGGEKFAEGYGEVLTQNLRRRRIFSNFLNTKDSLQIIKSHMDLDDLIRTTDDIQEKLNKLKKYFNPIVYFFCFGIEKELDRIKRFAMNLHEEKDEKK